MTFVLLVILAYFLPSIIGHDKRHAAGIFLLNFFLGWTFIGWIVALLWACTSDVPAPVPVPVVSSRAEPEITAPVAAIFAFHLRDSAASAAARRNATRLGESECLIRNPIKFSARNSIVGPKPARASRWSTNIGPSPSPRSSSCSSRLRTIFSTLVAAAAGSRAFLRNARRMAASSAWIFPMKWCATRGKRASTTTISSSSLAAWTKFPGSQISFSA